MNHSSRDTVQNGFIAEVTRIFEISKRELIPKSVWFSYGSNMDARDFEARMHRLHSGLKLVNARVAELKGYAIFLGNASKEKGLAYTIRRQRGSVLKGIMHEVPVEELRAYLRKEGVANERHVKCDEERTYNIVRVKATCEGSKIAVLFLKGCRAAELENLPRSDTKLKGRLTDYVETCEAGAKSWQIDFSDFEQDRGRILHHFD